MQSPRWIAFAGILAVLICFAPEINKAQDPAPQAPPAAPVESGSKPQKQKYSHANDFLILGTVFNSQGYAFPGVELKIRRSTDKKYRWDSFTNSRGDFAVRVPQGSDYEMLVHAKGFADQTRALSATTGVSEARIVFRMELAEGGKK
jgi:Carboxypeptidase regulatory-like domain